MGYQAYKQLTTSVFWQRSVSSLSIWNSESQQCLEEPIANQADALTPDKGGVTGGARGAIAPPKNCTVGLSSTHYVLPLAVCRSFSPPNLILLPPPLTPDLGSEQASNVTERLLPSTVHFEKYREPVLEYEDENA